MGNQLGMSSLWGHIKGPGPDDYVTFPKGSTPTRILNSIIPDLAPPTISLISDTAGAEPIAENTFTRTEEILTIVGDEMASATAVEIMDNDLVLQTIMPVDKYIISNGRIDIPAGVLNDTVEGTLRQVRIWNSVGPSELSTQKFRIETGRPVITGTTSDDYVFDRATILTVNGYGFKSRTTGETMVDRIRVDNAQGQSVYDSAVYNSGANDGTSDGIPLDVSAISGGIVVNSDTQLVLPINAMSYRADGPNRRLRVARRAPTGGLASNVDEVLSPGSNPLFSDITSKPVLTSLSQNNASLVWENVTSTGMYKRDRLMEINGTALNTATTIEVVQEDGTSFANPVFIQLPNAAATVDDNGTRIRLAGDAIPWADADTNTTSKRAFKIYNAVANSDLNSTLMFAVNTLPKVNAIGTFSNAGYFNRDKTLGDDFVIFGTGFNGVSEIVFTDDNNANANHNVSITLPAPGVTVTDTLITVDTQTLQVGSGADTDVNSSRRIIKLTSARLEANSPVSQRFYMGAPPAISSLSGISSGNYTRDSDTITVAGSGFGHVTSLEIVDSLGNAIVGASGLTPGVGGTGGGLTLVTDASMRVDPSATGWVNIAHLLDTVTVLGRRIKITTPFGSITSTTADGFTVSAKPEFMDSIQSTFAGGGYTADDPSDPNDGNGTYDRSEGDLVINGKNYRGVAAIEFYSGVDRSDGNFTIDPLNPPAGIAVNSDGTQIVIASTTLPASWDGNNATINFVSVAGSSSGNSTVGVSLTRTPIQVQD